MKSTKNETFFVSMNKYVLLFHNLSKTQTKLIGGTKSFLFFFDLYLPRPESEFFTLAELDTAGNFRPKGIVVEKSYINNTSSSNKNIYLVWNEV